VSATLASGVGSAPRFRCSSDDRLAWFEGDEQCVVFDRASGETHLLNALGAATVCCLEAEALDLHELSSRLSADLGVPDDPRLRGPLVQLLRTLEACGLVEQA
jgi:PqqD family protein of HPr-rel-A system